MRVKAAGQTAGPRPSSVYVRRAPDPPINPYDSNWLHTVGGEKQSAPGCSACILVEQKSIGMNVEGCCSCSARLASSKRMAYRTRGDFGLVLLVQGSWRKTVFVNGGQSRKAGVGAQLNQSSIGLRLSLDLGPASLILVRNHLLPLILHRVLAALSSVGGGGLSSLALALARRRRPAARSPRPPHRPPPPPSLPRRAPRPRRRRSQR
jgi:hypothetical protein